MPRPKNTRSLSLDDIKYAMRAFPGIEEGLSYGTLAFRADGRLFARLHQRENALVLKMGFDEREVLMDVEPDIFFITDHYKGSPWILVRLNAVSRQRLNQILEPAWRSFISKNHAV